MTLALLLVPLLIAIGMGLDFARAYSVRSRLQAELDFAVLSAARDMAELDDAAVKAQIENWFAAQTSLNADDYTLGDVSVTVSGQEISARVEASVSTTLLALGKIDTVDVSVTSSAAGAGRSYLNVYIVLDKSASMLLAATPADQQALMSSEARCAFACHTIDGGPYIYNKKKYKTVYDLSVAMGVKLRTDVALDAVREVLDMIDASDASHQRIRVGLYTLGKTATEVLAPTFSTTTARATLEDSKSGLTSATSEDATYFDYSFTSLKSLVGAAGDGATSTAPRKLVLILTDGVQSERNWVLQTSTGIRFPTSTGMLQTVVTPFNPDWCSPMKNAEVSVGVLYTTYLPMTFDWGYNATLGKTIGSSSYGAVWGGTIPTGAETQTRQTFIPTALSSCASNSSLFIEADSAPQIEQGLSDLFKEYLS